MAINPYLNPDLPPVLRGACERLNDASGETYNVEMHTDYPVSVSYSIHRRLPGGTWVTIRARLDEGWALDILTVFMPRPAFKVPLADPLGDPLGNDAEDGEVL